MSIANHKLMTRRMEEAEVIISGTEINKSADRGPNVNVDSFASLFLVHINGNNYHRWPKSGTLRIISSCL